VTTGTPDAENPDSAGTMIRTYHASSTVQQHGVPGQSWSASQKVLFPGYVRHTEQLVAGPDAYDTYGFRVRRS
jgi:hypothetical protein